MFKVDSLEYSYPGNAKKAVDKLSFEVKDGEIYGLLGPSGAGKSTTQKILIKLIKDYKGTITYKDKPLRAYDNGFYEDIGVSFEMPISFSKLTAMENLDFFRRLYKRTVDVEPLMKRVGLWDDRDRKAGEYSKGMKIRLNFVRALINGPKVLFLDEPTNGIDPLNARIMKDMILEFKQAGGTVFLASHIMSDVDQLCDRVGFIINGRIHEEDTPRNLKLKYGKKVVTVEYRENGLLKSSEFSMDALKGEDFAKMVREKQIETIHSGETTLEEIFIKVTGVALHEQQA